MFKEKSGVEKISSSETGDQILSLIQQSVKEVTTEKEFNALGGQKDFLCEGDIRKIVEDFEYGKVSLNKADTTIKDAEDALNQGKEIVVVKNKNGVETHIVDRN